MKEKGNQQGNIRLYVIKLYNSSLVLSDDGHIRIVEKIFNGPVGDPFWRPL